MSMESSQKNCEVETSYCDYVPYLPTDCEGVRPGKCLTDFGCQTGCYPKPVLPVQPPYLGWLAQVQYQTPGCCPNTKRECENPCREVPVPLKCTPDVIVCPCPEPTPPCADNNGCCDDDDEESWITLCTQGVKSKFDAKPLINNSQPIQLNVGAPCTTCGGH